MRAEARTERWPLRGQFGISRGISTESYVLHVSLEVGGIRGVGEAEAAEVDPIAAERTRRVCAAFLKRIPPAYTRAQLQHDLPPGPIRNAIDCALWDIDAKRTGRRVWELAGVDPGPVRTLFTIGLDSPTVMASAADAHRTWPWLKVKLGGPGSDDDLGRINAVREAAPDAKLLVDINGGWTRAQLDAYRPALAALGVSVIEQPLAPGLDDSLADWAGPVPLCADESITDRLSLDALAAGYRFINIKLDKTGGLTEALALATAARVRGLGVMVGCNLGTSLAIAPALLIARYADIVDLDSPLLLAADRGSPLTYKEDLISWPEPALWG